MKFNIKKIILYGFITVYVLFFVKFCVLPAIPSRLYFALDEAWGDTPIDSTLYINFAEITPFEWDTMYYYTPVFPRDSIYEIHKKDLGFTTSSIVEGRLVFTKQGRVVYAMEPDCYVEETSRTLYFTLDSVNWVKSREDACFVLSRVGKPFMLASLPSIND